MLKKERIKIGWAETDVTPGGKCELYGQYYQRVSEGIHSRLGATALALESESGEQAVKRSAERTQSLDFEMELHTLRSETPPSARTPLNCS